MARSRVDNFLHSLGAPGDGGAFEVLNTLNWIVRSKDEKIRAQELRISRLTDEAAHLSLRAGELERKLRLARERLEKETRRADEVKEKLGALSAQVERDKRTERKKAGLRRSILERAAAGVSNSTGSGSGVSNGGGGGSGGDLDRQVEDVDPELYSFLGQMKLLKRQRDDARQQREFLVRSFPFFLYGSVLADSGPF
jgi:hypothetical protein